MTRSVTPQLNQKPLTPAEAVEICSDGVVSVREAAQLAGVSRAQIYIWINDGTIVSLKQGKRRLVPRRAVVALTAANLLATQSQG